MKKDHVGLQRRPFLTPVWLSVIAAVAVLVLAVWLWGTVEATMVIVIRHAEKELGSVTDPPLTPAGEARAELLARMFGGLKSPGQVNAIYVTSALRNRLTAAPLAARLGLTPSVVDKDPRNIARILLRDHPGGIILVVGHSESVPKIVSALSGNTQIPEMGHQEFDTMYIVTVPRIGHSTVLRLKY